MKRSTLLIADSNLAVVQEIRTRVAHLDLETICAASWPDLIECVIHRRPDAIILRDTWPDVGGFETARLIRAVSEVPILFISDHSDRLARQRGLQMGDEYISLPRQWDRLAVHMAILLNRYTKHVSGLSVIYDDGYLKVDISEQVATREGNLIHLSNTEFPLFR